MPEALQNLFLAVYAWMQTTFAVLHNEPGIALFLSIGIGFAVGSQRLGPVRLGGVCGTLLTALVLGLSGVVVAPEVKSIFFAIFIFALGYAGGPQFFASLNAKGLRLGILSLIELFGVITLATLAMRFFHFDAGTTAGLIAGSATESAVIGTASDAISRLPLEHAKITELQANVVTAYSITYIFGLVSIVIFTSQIAPILLRVDLKQEAETLWQRLGGNDANSLGTLAAPELEGRLYTVSAGAGKTVGQINDALTASAGPGKRAHIEGVRRKGKILDAAATLRLAKGDAVLVMGYRASVALATAMLGAERHDAALLDRVVQTEEYLYSGGFDPKKTLAEMAERVRAMGLPSQAFLAGVSRSGKAMPIVPELTLQQGDIIRLYGAPDAVMRIGSMAGKRLQRNDHTNFMYIGAGVVLGILIGKLSFPLGGVDFSLGTGGGALVTGLIFGWLQSKHSGIAPTSPAALDIMKDLGLAAFVACVGLASGPQAFALAAKYGLVMPAVGVCIALTPALVSLLVGRFILKLDVPVLLGAIAGQQCSTPALSAVQAAAGNSTPLMGYTITYAISNALLPLLGPVVVHLAM